MRRVLEAHAAFRLPRGLQPERVQWLYDGAAATAATSSSAAADAHLLYWMQTSVRAKYNYALEYAIAAANALAVPLRVVYVLADRAAAPAGSADPNAWGFATARHAKFGLEGLLAAHQRLRQRGVQLYVLHQRAQSRERLLRRCARGAALVVTDRPYLRPWREALDACAAAAAAEPTRWGLVQVEGDVVVPCEVASDKEEYAARTIRPRITRQLPKFLVELEHLEVSGAARSDDDSAAATWLASLAADDDDGADDDALALAALDVSGATPLNALLAPLDVDRSVRGVAAFTGGEAVAVAVAKRFLETKLLKYADERNEPSGDGGSNLSLYLRFGHISPVRVALAAHKVAGGAGGALRAGRDAFLEELIVRRELAVNMAVFNPRHYDAYACLPPFATATLAAHADDPRAHVYSRAQLEAAATGDVYWNAAQRELVATGAMHGYMRMYWGKKILEWTASPQEGYAAALALNNKYSLDAPDPNSYAGVAWTFGKHDQGWKERPIFGKVRYMNEAGLKRKFRMDAYVRKAQLLARAYGADPADEDGDSGEPGAEGVATARKASGGAERKRTTLESFWGAGGNKDGAKATTSATKAKKAKKQ
ncbi:hypothetical protein PybrP1_003141 [[Pythium] brassicae (nom. inval.)]|nr:hypothetical protein PybrP1_003141 [[Pythium] brassicae (nom. inval.)]